MLHQFMCFLNELYFAFISHLFFRLDIGGFSSAAKMHLALKKIFPVLVPSWWLTETARDQTAMETASTSSCSCPAAEKQMQLATVGERRHTRWNNRLPSPSDKREPVGEPGLHGGRSETCPCKTLIKPSPIPPGLVPCTLPLRRPILLHPAAGPGRSASARTSVLRHGWTWDVLWCLRPAVPLLCPDLAAPSVGPPCPRPWHPAPAPSPPQLPGVPSANPTSPRAGAAALRKQRSVLQEEGIWINADRSLLKAQGHFPSPK